MKRSKKITLSLALVLTLVIGFSVSVFAAETENDFGKPPKELLDISQEEWDVLRLTNIERAKADLPLLVTFDAVQNAAAVRAGEVVSVFGHTRPDGSNPNTALDEQDYSYTAFAENIAFGQISAEEVVKDWMDSPGHRANILRKTLRHLGVGYKDNGWAQIFATDTSSDAVSLDYNEELGYFTLILKSGITAYAPYDPISSPTVDKEVTFHYPGVLPKTGTKAPDDGWYNLRSMNNHLGIDASGGAELRNNTATGNQVYYIENKGSNQITLRTAAGSYLGISRAIKDGVRLMAVDEPYLWNAYTENKADIFSLRPSTNIEMVVNASGEKNKDGTKIILWTHTNMDAPNHAEFRFIPASAPNDNPTPALHTPGSFTIGKASASSAKCTWKAVKGASGYEIYFATSENGTFKKSGSTTKELQYTKASLKAGKKYCFKIRAYKTEKGEKVYGEFTKVKSIKM